MNIIIDTREKNPWLFTKVGADTVSKKLDTGDYTIEGMEDKLCIERKQSVAEFANNITTDRFKRELERMAEFPAGRRFIICEFDCRHIDDFPEGSDIPAHLKRQVRVKGPFLFKCLSRILLKYNISVLYCSSAAYAEHVAYSILKETYADET